MTSNSYLDIKDKIVTLSRRNQYQILLNTSEWWIFRDKLFLLKGRTCNYCGQHEGLIEKLIPIDEWERKLKEYHENNNPSKFKMTIQDLLNGDYVGKPIFSCRTTIVGEIVLQIHHKLYFNDKLSWEYNFKNLQILCSACHKLAHTTTIIYTYKDETMQFRKQIANCSKCHGLGNIIEYSYRENGICYECGGAGVVFDNQLDWQTVT